MKKTKFALATLSIIGLLGYSTFAFATTPETIHINTTDASGTPYIQDLSAPSLNGSGVWLLGLDPSTGAPITFQANSGFSINGSVSGNNAVLDIFNLPSSAVQTLDNFKFDTNNSLTAIYGYLASATSTLGVVTSAVSALPALNAFMSTANSNLFGTSTNMTCANASTTNCLMTKAQGAKLDAMAGGLPWSWATSTRSIVTGTGATGFQVSATRNQTVHYNVKVTTTASIAGNADGYITLEVAPTNSATSSDWIEMGRCGNSQALTLAVTLQSVQGTSCELVGDIPAGYYAKLRSVTTTGTVGFAYVSGQEVLK